MSENQKLRASPIFAQLLDDLREHKIKRRLKAAFRRKLKPARVKPQNEDCK